MSARQLNRLARAKGTGLDPLLGGALNEEQDESDSEEEESEEESNTRVNNLVSATAAAFGDDSSDDSSSDDDGSSNEEEDDGHDPHFRESAERSGQNDRARNNDQQKSFGLAKTSTDDSMELALLLRSCAGGTSIPREVFDGITPPQSISDVSRDKANVDTDSYALPGATKVAMQDAAKMERHTRKQPPAATAAAAAQSAPDKRPENKDDDDEYLDRVIAELQQATGGKGSSAHGEQGPLLGSESPLAQFLRCDPRCLKLENELRRKFGSSIGAAGAGADADDNAGPGPGAAGGRTGRRRGLMPRGVSSGTGVSLALKRLVVSTPKEDWPKPPSLIGGGLGMSRVGVAPTYLPVWQREAHQGAEWYVFKQSESLQQLQRKFEAIQGMHDPNLLAAFASQAPYHADALLQLAMVFAHTGQMDRASEFVGRCLYVLESACMEGFRPVEGASRLDSSVQVNKTYFAAMFRHMQMSSMMGGARTALEVGRLLLSLDPLGDPMGCLLALDNHALASRQGDFVIELHKSRLPLGFSASTLIRATHGGAMGHPGYGTPPEVTVQDLPGLSISLGLAMLDARVDVSSARDAMSSALLRFPVLLEPLLEKCGLSPRSTTYPQNWKSVMEHPHFGSARARVPHGHVLLHLASIFAERGGEIWKHERAQELLYDGAGIALQGLVTAQRAEASSPSGSSPTGVETPDRVGAFSEAESEVMKRAYGPTSPVNKYLDLAVSDFVEEGFARLPQDVNILDPRLMGPNFMNERIRFQLPRGVGGGAGGGGGGGGVDDLVAMAMALGHDNVQADAFRDIGGLRHRGREQRRRGGHLNPEAPLMQLFWQSLLPWNVFPTPSRPMPRPPAWL